MTNELLWSERFVSKYLLNARCRIFGFVESLRLFGGIFCRIPLFADFPIPSLTMKIREPQIQGDLDEVRLCLAGDQRAQESLYARCFSQLTRLLQSRGAEFHDAEALAADVLSECLYGLNGRAPRLSRFSGRSSLSTWISRVAIHRYIDSARRKQRFSEERIDEDFMESSSRPTEEMVLALVKDALLFAFAKCEAMDVVLLQLVHGHLVEQRQVARLFGWSDAKLCRRLASAREHFRESARGYLQDRDVHLVIGWNELVEACSQLSITD